MAPLSISTYGKANTTMDLRSIADRITAALEDLRNAAAELKGSAETGAPVQQNHVNALNTALDSLGEVAGDARQAAADHGQATAPASDAGAGAASGSDTAAGPGPQNTREAQASGNAGDATMAGQASSDPQAAQPRQP